MKFPPASKYASRSLNDNSLSMDPMPNWAHLSPMLIPPRASGDTWIPALVDRRRYRPSLVGGGGGGAKRLIDASDLMYNMGEIGGRWN